MHHVSDVDLVDNIVDVLLNGRASEAIEIMLRGNKTNPRRLAAISSVVTSTLITRGELQALKFFTSTLIQG